MPSRIQLVVPEQLHSLIREACSQIPDVSMNSREINKPLAFDVATTAQLITIVAGTANIANLVSTLCATIVKYAQLNRKREALIIKGDDDDHTHSLSPAIKEDDFKKAISDNIKDE